MDSAIDVPGLAMSYKRLVLLFGAQLLCSLFGLTALFFPPQSIVVFAIVWFRLLAVIVTIIAITIYAYRVSKALGSRVSLLWAMAMVVPCVNTITLLALSSNATRACRANGIPVGFLGPKVQ